MRPLIAVTSTTVPEAGPYRRPQIALYAIYVDVFERFGLSPLLLTPVHSLRSLPVVMDHCHGLVLTGGEDVDPALYGEAPIPGIGIVNPERDAMELAVLRLALEREMAILGICRGLQLMNVCMGGTLYQDLATQRPDPLLRHDQGLSWERRAHLARVVPGSRFSRIVQTEELTINSFHHQAIKDVADALEVVAVAEDGTIEAAEVRDHPWAIGVQWHPERDEATRRQEPDPDVLLLNAFRDAVRAYARGALGSVSRRRGG